MNQEEYVACLPIADSPEPPAPWARRGACSACRQAVWIHPENDWRDPLRILCLDCGERIVAPAAP